MFAKEISELYYNLWQRLQTRHTSIDFYRFEELHYEIFGRMHPLCYYKRILMRKMLNMKLKDKEINDLKILNKKYGQIDVLYLIPTDRMSKDQFDKNSKNNFKVIYNEMSEDAKEESPAFSEFIKLMRNNVDFAWNNKDNLALYDFVALRRFFNLIQIWIETPFIINNDLTIRLTTQGFIHIVTGHLKMFKIPRKEMLINFINEDDWIGVIYLLNKIINHLTNEIKVSFEKNNRYDNPSIFFEKKGYGLHIHKNKTISAFYPVPIVNNQHPFQE